VIDAEAINRVQTTAAPWPEGEAPVLFVLFGDDEFDREVMRARVLALRPARSGAHWFASVSEGRGQTLEHTGLASLADAPPGLIVAPIGLAWKSRGESAGKDPLHSPAGPKGARRKERVLRGAPQRCVLIVGEAATKVSLRARFERSAAPESGADAFADFIARQAAVTVDREQRRAGIGAIKLPRFVVEAVMARRSFQADLKALAESAKRDYVEIAEDARKCLRQIAPTPTPFFVRQMERLARTLYTMGYDAKIVFDEERAAKIRDLVRRSPTALLFTHKSHIDGLAMIALTRQLGFPLVHLVGGVNMAFLGMGTIAKKSGTIFIRRSFQDDAVYKLALRHYLGYILEKHFPLAWSLEGTRSRIGKLMPPRFGILKYVVEAARRTAVRDLTIVPVSIYYDLIPEIASYADEQAGAVKKKESLSWFFGYMAGLRKPMGRIYVEFGAPIAAGPEAERPSPAANEDLTLDLQRLAFETAVNINSVTPLTASGVISFVMIAAAPRALTADEIRCDLRALRDWATLRSIPMTGDFREGGDEKFSGVARALIDAGVLKRYDEGLEPVYGVAPGHSFTASYYRNTVMHFFVNNAMLELALARAMECEAGRGPQAFWDSLAEIRDLFKFEFFYPKTEDFRRQVADELARQNPAWETLLWAGGRSVEQLIETLSPLFAHGTLKPYIEAYAVVSDALLRLKPDEAAVSEKAIAVTCLKLGRDALLRGRITGEESIAKDLYANGVRHAAHRGLLSGPGAGSRAAFAQEMQDLQRRLRLIEAIAARRRAAGESRRAVVDQAPALTVAGTG